jgi:hypothetical protein
MKRFRNFRSRALTLFIFALFSQIISGQGAGSISGSIMSSSHYYYNDAILGLLAPADRFASNNYLWMQYQNGPFSAGIQYEAYMPPLQGFAYQYEGNYISHRFIRYKKGIIDLTGGNFYEQFGSGLSFRSYEDRALGFNNSLDGIRFVFRPANWVTIKSLWGKQRRFDSYSDSYIRGVDGSLDIGSLLKTDNSLTVGGGLVSRYQLYTGPDINFPSTVNSINSRIKFESEILSIYTEYIIKSDDPQSSNLFSKNRGDALLLNSTLTTGNFGFFVSARFLKEMDFQAERSYTDSYSTINYIPSNTRQYTYSVLNLYPYSTQVLGEASVKVDLNYSLPKGSGLAAYGTDLRFNSSLVNGLSTGSSGKEVTISFGDEKYYRDYHFEITRRWNSKLMTIIALQNTYFNKGVVEGGGSEIVKSNAAIADIQYRFTRKLSFRTEIEHLWTADDQGNWAAIKGELSYSPFLSVFASDMTNYQYNDQVHYFSFGTSLSFDNARVSIGYGRNREGYICSGGICRKIPAYKGFNLSITTSF